MNQQDEVPRPQADAGKARHGYRNEVNWEGGSGRQPYANQDSRATPGPDADGGVEEGNRRERSGENLAQLEAVKRKP